jgi:molybdate transport system substrate-binding protein
MLTGLMMVLAWAAGAVADEPGETTVAVAANFIGPAEELAAEFGRRTGHRVILSSGSTGKHFAQITHGAPFTAFLAADEARPLRLEQEGRAVAGSRFTYAVGRVVLWSADPALVDTLGAVLNRGDFQHLALANEKLAPYGEAAVQIMRALGQWERLQPRLVRGETISQAFQFVQSGNARLGFVALSQVRALPADRPGSAWMVPARLHRPIRQQAVLLTDDPVARAFLEFLKSPAARDIITAYGYDLPE